MMIKKIFVGSDKQSQLRVGMDIFIQCLLNVTFIRTYVFTHTRIFSKNC